MEFGMRKIIFPGIAMIGVTYALARYSYGLLLPYISHSLSFSEAYAGVPGFFAYAAYCISLALAPFIIQRTGTYNTIQLAGLSAVFGMLGIAFSRGIITISICTFIAGFASGLSSPAYGQAVTENLPKEKRDRGNTWINTGTSFGLILSGPIALLFTEQWRVTYLFFAIIGIVVLFWNHRNIPKSRRQVDVVCFRKKIGAVSWKKVMMLSLATLITGICASIYWVFSRSFLTAVYDISEIKSSLFWLIMGISGIVGGIAGSIIEKFGLTSSYRGSLLVMITSLCLITIPSSMSIYGSAFLFGVTFIFLTGLFIVWGINLFEQAPSFGVSLAFLLLGIGQSVGSLFAGIIIEKTSYPFAFLLYAAIGLCGLFLKAHIPARTKV
jgi:predicted MFS family arabinose efflux permease